MGKKEREREKIKNGENRKRGREIIITGVEKRERELEKKERIERKRGRDD
jgi:hypothetical protein